MNNLPSSPPLGLEPARHFSPRLLWRCGHEGNHRTKLGTEISFSHQDFSKVNGSGSTNETRQNYAFQTFREMRYHWAICFLYSPIFRSPAFNTLVTQTTTERQRTRSSRGTFFVSFLYIPN